MFNGVARIYESQDEAVSAILAGKVVAGRCGDHSLRRPERRPWYARNVVSNSYLKSMGLGKACALVTDGRFLRVALPVYPSATCRQKRQVAALLRWCKMAMALISIFQTASYQIRISDAELQQRREAMDAKGKLGWKPLGPRACSEPGAESLRHAGKFCRQRRGA